MKTTKLLIVLCLAATAFAAHADGTNGHKQDPPATPAQAPNNLVSISANGTDVRLALHDLFAQMKMNYVIEPNVKFTLYLSLEKVDFDEAMGIICHLAKIKVDKQNGIYYVSNDVKGTKTLPQPVETPAKDVQAPLTSDPKAAPSIPVVGWKELRTKLVTTKMPKTSIKKVMAELSQQTGIPITIDPLVPDYKLDAFLNQTSLKYALDHIVAATHLHYTIVDRSSVKIYLQEESLILVNP
jgi:type II secretory pathway component GspD/PulD (secretin)